jgi:alkylation response protein AidB-like acyl-CoA dehydrogenase
MNFKLNEEQELIRKNARDFLTEKCPPSLVKDMEQSEEGFASKLWRQMAEMGWLGLAFPEKYGGTGGSFLDLMVLTEELGRVLAPVPFFSTVITGGFLLLEAGSEPQKEKSLPLLATGEPTLAFAFSEADDDWGPASVKLAAVTGGGGDYLLNGAKLFVANVRAADYLLCVARTAESAEENISLFMVASDAPGIQVVPLKNIAREKLAEVVFRQVRIPRENVIGEINQGWAPLERVLTRATLAKSIEMLGGMQRILEMTAEYAQQRIQFDQPIGGFQAVQHHCANMLIASEGARWLAYRTAWMLAEGIPCRKEIYMAKAWINETYQKVARLGVQVHGGLGIMEEYDLQLYFRRVKAAEAFLGDSNYCREKVAHQILG